MPVPWRLSLAVIHVRSRSYFCKRYLTTNFPSAIFFPFGGLSTVDEMNAVISLDAASDTLHEPSKIVVARLFPYVFVFF